MSNARMGTVKRADSTRTDKARANTLARNRARADKRYSHPLDTSALELDLHTETVSA